MAHPTGDQFFKSLAPWPWRRGLRRLAIGATALAVSWGLPPGLTGWRHVRREAPLDNLVRRGLAKARSETLHAPMTAANPLPRNVERLDLLNPDRDWFGFSFREVPARHSGPTRILNVGRARVVCYGGPGRPEQFHPAVVAADGRALELNQIIFRPRHAEILRAGVKPQRRTRAIWIFERVYDNHSHWLTAHLPKILLLRDRGMLDDMVLPQRRTAVIDDSFRLLGLDSEAFPVIDTDRPLNVDELILLETDRFRPELLRPVRDAFRPPDVGVARRRVFISRGSANRRRLLDEATLHPGLEARGFEIVCLEALDFAAQIRLMAETAVLLAPHGAGLTNMMFCPEGAQIGEIADPAYPNPNFYALACAMGHGYRLIPAEGSGSGGRLERDLAVTPDAVLAAADALVSDAAGVVGDVRG